MSCATAWRIVWDPHARVAGSLLTAEAPLSSTSTTSTLAPAVTVSDWLTVFPFATVMAVEPSCRAIPAPGVSTLTGILPARTLLALSRTVTGRLALAAGMVVVTELV